MPNTKGKAYCLPRKFQRGKMAFAEVKVSKNREGSKRHIECIGLHLNAWVVPEDVTIMSNDNTV